MKEVLKKIVSVMIVLTIVLSITPIAFVDSSAAGSVYLWPTPGQERVSSKYGWRSNPLGSGSQFHDGIDISCPRNSSIVATKAGVVVKTYSCKDESYCSHNFGYGNGVIIRHSDGSGYSFYAHMKPSPLVKAGDFVAQGELIGYSSSSGYSTGPHLHFGISKSCTRTGINENAYYGSKNSIDNNKNVLDYSKNYNDDYLRLIKYDKELTLMTTEANVRIRNKPYVEGDVMRIVKNIGTDVKVIGHFINERSNHLWYKTSDGYWVYSERVQAKSQKTVTYYQTAYVGKKYTRVPVTLPTTISQEKDSSYIIQGPAPTRDGYAFLGWSAKDNDTKVEYKIGDKVALKENLVLYPVWKKTRADMELSAYDKSFDLTKGNTATITLKSNGDFAEKGYKIECISDNSNVAVATSSGNPKYKNYILWDTLSDTVTITAKNPGTANIAISIVNKNGKRLVTQTVYVNVTTKYTISYNGTTKTQEKKHNKVVALIDYIPESTGKFFLGWSRTEKASTPEYGPGDLYYGNANLVLYPVWADVNYISYSFSNGTLTINGNGIMPSYPTGKTPWKDYASQVKNIVIQNGVKSVGANAFNGFYNLEKVSLPYSITSIGCKAFYNCSKLKNINFPVSIQKYGDRAFANCTSLQSVVLESLTKARTATTANVEIGSFVFEGCSNLKTISIPETISVMGNGVFTGCESLEAVALPNSISVISDTTFFGCSSLQEVIIPDTIKVIGDGAFSGCEALSSVSLPDGVQEIGDQAFSGCSELSEILIPDSVNTIGASSFSNCSALTTVELPENMDHIGDAMFSGCESLTEIDLPQNLNSLGDGSFRNCTALSSVVIPDSLSEISNSAFSGCSSLESITIPETVTKIGNYAFFKCSSMENVDLTEGLTDIGICAFSECDALKSIEIPVSVSSIGNGAFMYCSSLENVGIYESELSIGDDAFCGCSSLQSIYIPEGTIYIGSNVFSECSEELNVTCFSTSPVINDICEIATNAVIINPVESITLNYETFELVAAESVQLNASITPLDATYNNVVWASDCEEIATVSETGLVTGHNSGNAVITATTEDGKLVAECIVTVVVPINEIVIENKIQDAFVNNEYYIPYTMNPTNPTLIDVEWTSSNPEVASIDQSGLLIAKSEGEATITLKSLSSNVSDSFIISVKTPILVNEISLNKTRINLNIGEEEMLCATTKPENASFACVEWFSLDDSVVTVEPSGTIVAVGYGTTTITAVSLDGNAFATCEVTVAESHNICLWDSGKIITQPTCTEPGSIVYTCDCGATKTETIAATDHNFEGSACINCDYDKADDCSCSCHKSGIVNFFFKILLFFQRLFGVNKECMCGANHY